MCLSLWPHNAFLAFRRRQGKFLLDNRCVLVHYRTFRYQICKSVYSPARFSLTDKITALSLFRKNLAAALLNLLKPAGYEMHQQV